MEVVSVSSGYSFIVSWTSPVTCINNDLREHKGNATLKEFPFPRKIDEIYEESVKNSQTERPAAKRKGRTATHGF